VSRLERLERLANLEPGTVLPAAGATGAAPVGDPTPADEPLETPSPSSQPPSGVEVPSEAAPAAAEAAPAPPSGVEVPSESAPAPTETAPAPTEAAPTPAQATPSADAPHAASASSVDVGMLRRSWPTLLDHLSEAGQPVLRALLVSATPASFDGETLELAFPPSFRNNLRQVTARADKLQAALGDLFGIRPRIESVTREAHAGATEPAVADYVEEAEEPSEEEALKRLKDVLGATPADEPDAPED